MRKLLLFIVGLAFINPAYADFLGARLSGGMFDYSVSGSVRDSAASSDTVDVKNNLGWQDDKDVMGYLYIEHPIPFLPNVRLGTTSLKLGGSGTVSQSFTYGGKIYTVNDKVTSDLDLSHQEVALYYELIDTFVDLDVGLNFKMFDGKVKIDNITTGQSASSNVKLTVPMLYGAVGVPIPGTSLKLLGDFTTASYQNSTFTDYMVRVRYETDFMLGVELGYRSIHIDYQDSANNRYAKLDMKGPYLAATLSF